MTEDDDIKRAVKEVDDEEDREEKAREKDSAEGREKDEKIVYICPKCKSLVGEADFAEDEFTEAYTTGIASKIECTKCGYERLPVEVNRSDYQKIAKQAKGKKKV
jgi:DNA-directed RNA polymerase subunit RPC12/RpoP